MFGDETKGRKHRRKNFKKTSASVLTPKAAPDYIRLTNEGGAPLAAQKFALVEGNPESRVSDTLPGP